MQSDLRSAVLTLQLPQYADRETAIELAIEALCISRDLAEADAAVRLQADTDSWVATLAPSAWLLEVLDVALGAGYNRTPQIDGRTYCRLYERLVAGTTNSPGLSQAIARRLLSRLPLIEHLATAELLSSSQIVRVLATLETSLRVPYPAVSVLTRALGREAGLDSQVAGPDLLASDEERSTQWFPDTDANESSAMAGKLASAFAGDQTIELDLRRLSRSGNEPFWPYIQILHFCCIPVEFFDHPPSHLYEFAPRGQLAEQIVSRYPAATGNPFLNNAKAVMALDEGWAAARGGEDAQSLTNLLRALEALPYRSRREVARIIRAWCCRILQLQPRDQVHLPEDITNLEFWRLAREVSASDTSTRGVVEQRLVDALALLAFEEAAWKPKGIGDSVNASNLSSRKIGDVEFTDVDHRAAIAIEAHGGHLSAIYVAEHQRSLGRALRVRLDESWSALDVPEEWSVRVIFVAHSQDPDLPASAAIEGISVSFEYWSYEQLVEAATDRRSESEEIEVFSLHVRDALNRQNVRESARLVAIDLLGREPH